MEMHRLCRYGMLKWTSKIRESLEYLGDRFRALQQSTANDSILVNQCIVNQIRVAAIFTLIISQ